MKKILLVTLLVCFVFGSVALAEEFSADVNSVMAGMTTTSKIYFKDFKTNRTEAMGIVVISDGSKSYQLFENTKKYVVMDMNEVKQQSPMSDVEDFEEFIEKNNFEKVGTESVSGYKCDVYGGNISYMEGQPPMAMKLWYAPKLDYPIKNEAQLPAPMSGTAVSTLTNIKIGKQPGNLFKVPAGYTEARNAQEAMGMGGFSMPSGEGSGEMPSQEQIDQMMKMMQEMKENGQGQ